MVFAFGTSLVWLAFYNVRFWTDTAAAMWHGTAGSVAFLASLFVFAWSLQAILLLLMLTRRSLLGAASVLFIIAAMSSYFSTRYGTVMNKDMLRNVFETDAAESASLVTIDLVIRFIVLGLLPAVLVWKVRLPATRWPKRLRTRAVAIACALAVSAIALVSVSASYAVFFREHKPIRFTLMPVAPVSSAVGLMFDEGHAPRGPLINASGIAQRTRGPQAKPLVLVMVVGETARAANFQLGGYGRPTNAELLATPGVVYFSDATSCGTATAASVPCMFSHLSRKDFKVDEAPHYANVLDALKQAGLDIEWHDNNAGCKGVCARVETIQYHNDADPQLCRESYCYDDILLKGLAAKLATVQQDTVIVMHQIGSHGPAYAERYPPEFEKFKPACRSNQLQNCTEQEVVNAYDNTIAYTDHILARTVQILRDAQPHVDTLLIYASDHGESLGEQGLYLHGLPYAFAPETQKHVPMLMWLSPAYAEREDIAMNCLASNAHAAVSHDNLYHTLLGAAEVRNTSYQRDLDLLASCRAPPRPTDHE